MEIRTKTIERLRDALLESGKRKGAITSSAYRTLAREGLLSDDENEALERIAPAAEAMFLIIAADDEVTDTELAALRGAIRGLTGDILSDDIVQVMIEKYVVALKTEGRDKRLADIATATRDSGEALNTFSLCAAVALADGQVADSESSLIVELRELFKLSDEEVSTVLGELSDDD